MALNIQRKPGTVGQSSGDAKHKRQETPATKPEGSEHVEKSRNESSDNRKWVKPNYNGEERGTTPSVDFKPTTTKTYKGPPVAHVANIRKAELNKRGIKDLEEWVKDHKNVYIGRDMTCYVKGAVGSKWHNPFKSKSLGRDESVRRYEEYVRGSPTLMAQLGELKGKCLGCWCHPLSCHGHVLVRLLEEKEAKESD
ncbi:uncharacterized protein [Argopecten irradians]|uniref:uncharacterized protein n=1 Tax=Argopecten irradians TaxID=31199 RepID=UPI00371CDBB8